MGAENQKQNDFRLAVIGMIWVQFTEAYLVVLDSKVWKRKRLKVDRGEAAVLLKFLLDHELLRKMLRMTPHMGDTHARPHATRDFWPFDFDQCWSQCAVQRISINKTCLTKCGTRMNLPSWARFISDSQCQTQFSSSSCTTVSSKTNAYINSLLHESTATDVFKWPDVSKKQSSYPGVSSLQNL